MMMLTTTMKKGSVKGDAHNRWQVEVRDGLRGVLPNARKGEYRFVEDGPASERRGEVKPE